MRTLPVLIALACVAAAMPFVGAYDEAKVTFVPPAMVNEGSVAIVKKLSTASATILLSLEESLTDAPAPAPADPAPASPNPAPAPATPPASPAPAPAPDAAPAPAPAPAPVPPAGPPTPGSGDSQAALDAEQAMARAKAHVNKATRAQHHAKKELKKVIGRIKHNMDILRLEKAKEKARERAALLRCPPAEIHLSNETSTTDAQFAAAAATPVRSCRGLVSDYHHCSSGEDLEAKECRSNATEAIRAWKDNHRVKKCPADASGNECRAAYDSIQKCPTNYLKASKDCRKDRRYKLVKFLMELRFKRTCNFTAISEDLQYNCTKIYKDMKECPRAFEGAECREQLREQMHSLKKAARKIQKEQSNLSAGKRECFEGALGKDCRRFKRQMADCPSGTEGDACRADLEKKITAELPGNKSSYPYEHVCPYGYQGIECRKLLRELKACPKGEIGKACRTDLREQMIDWRYSPVVARRLERENRRKALKKHRRPNHISRGGVDDFDMDEEDDPFAKAPLSTPGGAVPLPKPSVAAPPHSFVEMAADAETNADGAADEAAEAVEEQELDEKEEESAEPLIMLESTTEAAVEAEQSAEAEQTADVMEEAGSYMDELMELTAAATHDADSLTKNVNALEQGTEF